MARPETEHETTEFQTRHGKVAVRLSGVDSGPLAILVHGLSANHVAFDLIAQRLEQDGWRVAALDLRGRGASPDTGPGTYGLHTHAEDVVDIAHALGRETFAMVGWSLGALIGITLAHRLPGHLESLVVIDHAGDFDDSAGDAVWAGLDRLDAVAASPDEYVARLRDLGAVQPWEPLWDSFYSYELTSNADGWRPRTSKAAGREDYTLLLPGTMHERWPALTMPVTLIRALVPLNGGFIVPSAELARFNAAVPQLRVVEVDRNHYGVMTHPDTIEAVASSLNGAR